LFLDFLRESGVPLFPTRTHAEQQQRRRRAVSPTRSTLAQQSATPTTFDLSHSGLGILAVWYQRPQVR
jgi:hypothetical protein